MNNKILVVCLGSSDLLYKCARIIKKHYENEIDLQVIDVDYSPMKARYKKEFGDVDRFSSKQEIFEWLDKTNMRTILLSVNNPYIIPASICENPNLTMINLHHALLPKHPGRNAEAWTIYDMDQYGGITWHYINAGVDSGDIICQRKVEINLGMTSLMLLKECEALAMESLQNVLLPFENLNTVLTQKQIGKQDEIKLAKDVPNGGMLDLSWSIDKMIAFLCAMDYGITKPLGSAQVVIDDMQYTIRKYVISETVLPQSELLSAYNKADNILMIEQKEKCLTLYLK